ncbi:hypothetical protein ACFQ3R_13620 [Mesonia ostreae]|uniref:Lipoprotein n=1 Tax=Mesonia ostreae TaxID=861110 RepID=A0ABU2KFY0_9FLAO|nr:hypothetical protein [Mesonia ostreae]MDT0293621.1 hypothetical protein [Mesonia ostreae]
MNKFLILLCVGFFLFSCKEEKNPYKETLDPTHLDHQVEHAFVDMSRKFNEKSIQENDIVDSIYKHLQQQKGKWSEPSNILYTQLKEINTQLDLSIEKISALESETEMEEILTQLEAKLVNFKDNLTLHAPKEADIDFKKLTIEERKLNLKGAFMSSLYYLKFKLARATKQSLKAMGNKTSF